MAKKTTNQEDLKFTAPTPELQIAFAAALAEVRKSHLQEALRETVSTMHIPDIDVQLARFAPAHSLATLAGRGIRGEMIFPVPVVLLANPRLLGYYRLLFGYSQKEFYTKETGFRRLKAMEDRGVVAATGINCLEDACTELCKAGAMLLAGIGIDSATQALLHDLSLLTLGPQLRGGANVKRGTAGIRVVFKAIHEIVKGSVVKLSATSIELRNAAGKKVLVEFAPDPDIVIRSEMGPGVYRELIAIEVKAGADFSNIHNRLGEAEKSHQKARERGYAECWTIVNVDKMDEAMAVRESPSTHHFYRLSDLIAAEGEAYIDFRYRIEDATGIAKISD